MIKMFFEDSPEVVMHKLALPVKFKLPSNKKLQHELEELTNYGCRVTGRISLWLQIILENTTRKQRGCMGS